jgi:hypothetical protein
MAHQTHLNKSGEGWFSKTACGRNIHQAPIGMNWENFKNESPALRCIKCVASKQFEVNTKMDARNSDKSIPLTEKQYLELERSMQWPEDLAAYDRLNRVINGSELGLHI